MLAFSLRCWDQ